MVIVHIFILNRVKVLLIVNAYNFMLPQHSFWMQVGLFPTRSRIQSPSTWFTILCLLPILLCHGSRPHTVAWWWPLPHGMLRVSLLGWPLWPSLCRSAIVTTCQSQCEPWNSCLLVLNPPIKTVCRKPVWIMLWTHQIHWPMNPSLFVPLPALLGQHEWSLGRHYALFSHHRIHSAKCSKPCLHH